MSDEQRVAPMTRDEATCIVRSIFRRCGYAIGEHGTRGRDLDLMAMPWTDRAGIPELIVEEVARALEAPIVNGPEEKPHGRRAWSIHPRHTARHDLWYVDLSVIVPSADSESREVTPQPSSEQSVFASNRCMYVAGHHGPHYADMTWWSESREETP